MANNNLVAKPITATRADGTTYQTTVWVRPEDAGALKMDMSIATPVSATTNVVPSPIDPDNLKKFTVKETTIRDNPALTIEFPDRPDYKFHIVADDGRGDPDLIAGLAPPHRPGIILIAETDFTKANLEDYEKGGQEFYGSPEILYDGLDSFAVLADGDVTPFEDLETCEPAYDEDSMKEFAQYDYDDFDTSYYGADGRPLQNHFLSALAQTEEGKRWLDAHAVRNDVPTKVDGLRIGETLTLKAESSPTGEPIKAVVSFKQVEATDEDDDSNIVRVIHQYANSNDASIYPKTMWYRPEDIDFLAEF